MFQYGLNGIRIAGLTSRLNLLSIFAILAGVLCFLLKVSVNEQVMVLVCIIIVFAFEMINTSIELICNMIEPNQNIKIKEIKDISAGAVLLSALGSGIVGWIIFMPKLVNLFLLIKP